ncbi:MAG: hypothetical protein ACREUQ_00240 [Burkholderiales bacterium]
MIAGLALCALIPLAQAQLEKRDVHISVAERRLMVWQPRSGETERI